MMTTLRRHAGNLTVGGTAVMIAVINAVKGDYGWYFWITVAIAMVNLGVIGCDVYKARS